jgi:hypothetical protein
MLVQVRSGRYTLGKVISGLVGLFQVRLGNIRLG